MTTEDWKKLLLELDGEDVLVAVVEQLRPGTLGDSEEAVNRFQEALAAHPDCEEHLEAAVRAALAKRRLVFALANSGILPERSLLEDLTHRLSSIILPLPGRDDDVRSLIHKVFHRSGDWRWVRDVPDRCWVRIFQLFIREEDFVGIPHEDVALSILGLAQRAGALGIDDEVYQRLPSPDDYEWFLELTPRARTFLDDHAEGRGSKETFDALVETVTRCRELIEQVRAERRNHGTSLRLTARSRRLLQQLQRLELLVHLVHPRDGHDFARSLVPLFKEVIEAELTARNLARAIQGHADLFAFQITEETAKKGIKYVTDTTADYWVFLRKAMVGGAIVAVFAIVKAFLYKLDVSLAGRAFLFSINYAVCFVLIYLTGSILATKQPAMTASMIGRRLDEAQSEQGATTAVGELIVRVWRSQFISFVGNLICAFPIAILIVWGLDQAGIQVADAAKAKKLIGEIDPFRSAALFFAAVAGVYLFLSGVISGWVENFAVYNRLETRLRALPWPGFLGNRAEQATIFVLKNLGVVTGNVVLGFMLGTASTIGYIFGLPFDIRHIAFSSANFGVALYASPERFDVDLLLVCALGVASIGFVNFFVSFGLTLLTTLESRRASFREWRYLLAWLGTHLFRRPLDWIYPPKDTPDSGA